MPSRNIIGITRIGEAHIARSGKTLAGTLRLAISGKDDYDTAVTMLKIHVRHGKPVGGSELARMRGIGRSTVVSNFNRRPEWWKKVEGSTDYKLTDEAIAAATLLTGGQQA